jgi:hypothetical protein
LLWRILKGEEPADLPVQQVSKSLEVKASGRATGQIRTGGPAT